MLIVQLFRAAPVIRVRRQTGNDALYCSVSEDGRYDRRTGHRRHFSGAAGAFERVKRCGFSIYIWSGLQYRRKLKR